MDEDAVKELMRPVKKHLVCYAPIAMIVLADNVEKAQVRYSRTLERSQDLNPQGLFIGYRDSNRRDLCC